MSQVALGRVMNLYESFREAVPHMDPEIERPWEAARLATLVRDNYQCRLCGRRDELDVHHVIRRSLAGRHQLRNLITLCREHHNWIGWGWLKVLDTPGGFSVEYRRTDGTAIVIYLPYALERPMR